MTFKSAPGKSVLLMSVRANSPYPDAYMEDHSTVIYQGHDAPGDFNGKKQDQPLFTKTGALTENGKFYRAVMGYLRGFAPAPKVNVYQKIMPGIWCFNGEYHLTDAWNELADSRKVFFFKLEPLEKVPEGFHKQPAKRHIPSWVKVRVYQRDRGRCALCGSEANLHFDHIIPYSKGGRSDTPKNIQLLCARHNLQKRDRVI